MQEWYQERQSSAAGKTSKHHKDNKKSFSSYINSRRLNKENLGQLLNGVGDLVTTETDKADIPNVFFAFVFPQQVLPVFLQRVQGGKGWPLADDDLSQKLLNRI